MLEHYLTNILQTLQLFATSVASLLLVSNSVGFDLLEDCDGANSINISGRCSCKC